MADLTNDLYEIFDRAGLQSSTFYNTKKSMDKIVLEVRAKLLEELEALLPEHVPDGR